MIHIKEIQNGGDNEVTLKDWEDLNLNHRFGTFFHSNGWIDFQTSLGITSQRLAFFDGNELVGICFIKEEPGRFGTILYSPRGPVMDWSNKNTTKMCLQALKDHFQNKGYLLLRVEPAIRRNSAVVKSTFPELGFKDSILPVQGTNRWILEINGREDEELLKWMRENGRRKKFGNFINTAKRSGVVIKFDDFPDGDPQLAAVDIFSGLLEALGERKSINVQDKDYFRKMKAAMGDQMLIPLAYLNGKPVAGAIIIAYGEESSFIYGASLPETGQTHATHLLHWEAIRKVRQMGVQRYNFWGVLEEKDYHPGNPGYGYSNFKRSFGGYVDQVIPPQDLVFNWIAHVPFKIQQRFWLRDLKAKGYL